MLSFSKVYERPRLWKTFEPKLKISENKVRRLSLRLAVKKGRTISFSVNSSSNTMSGEIRPEIESEEEQSRQAEGGDRRGGVRQEMIGFSEIEEITVAGGGGGGESDDGAWYVAVGRDEESSMDALQWTLRNRCLNKGGTRLPPSPPSPSPSSSTSSSSSTSNTGCVYLVHVFPPITHIPTPGIPSSFVCSTIFSFSFF